MADLIVYEKPTCTTCRKLFALLAERGIDAERVDYHVTGLTEAEIRDLLGKAGAGPRDVLRTREPAYAEHVAGRELRRRAHRAHGRAPGARPAPDRGPRRPGGPRAARRAGARAAVRRALPAVALAAALAAACGGAARTHPADTPKPATTRPAITVVAERDLDPRLSEWTLRTPALDVETRVRVLLPPGYGAHPERRYPVLYLLHGRGGDYRDWTRYGAAERITARTPLIVVMPDAGRDAEYTDW